MNGPRRKLLAGGAIVVLLTLGAVCFWPRQRLNVLLITLDTTRADRLGCYGYARARTPVIDRLAEEGIVFDQARTVAPLTLPAHASLFTGLFPPESGVRTNGRGQLPESIPTLAEILAHEGFDTGAFVASFVLDRKFGLKRGFHIYDDEFSGGRAGTTALQRQRDGASVIRAALDWLQRPRTKPFFCWVHLYDPHSPYESHAGEFGDEFPDCPYDAEIAYVDQQIGRLIDWLDNSAFGAQSLVVIVGDHGEGLGEHVERTHGVTLYDNILRVPLVFRCPSQFPAGTRIQNNVSIVDISPTILDLLRIRDRRAISGVSLGPLIRNTSGAPSVCYSATDEPYLQNGWSPLRAITIGSWKYVRTTEVELFDLSRDPGEQTNLATSFPEKRKEMEAALADLESRLVQRDETSLRLSASERQALASLGYLGGAGSPPTARPSAELPDIKWMLPFDNTVEDAAGLMGQGAFTTATNQLRDVLRVAPSHTLAATLLATSLQEQSRFDEASDVLLSLLEARPESPTGRYELGNLCVARGRLADAIIEFRKALEIDPDFAEAHCNLATAYVHLGQPADALAHYQAALQIDRGYTDAWQGLANLQARLGQTVAAIDSYESLLKIAPNLPDTHHNLAVVLAGLGRTDEALEHLREAAEEAPNRADLQLALGQFLMRQNRPDEAQPHLARSVELDAGNEPAVRALKGTPGPARQRRVTQEDPE